MPTNLVCHLLRLAPELRLTIYGHNFNDITMIHNPITSHFVTKNLANPPGILLASQQIHHVSIKLFYATATFSFECGIDAVHWMHTVPRAYLGVVTKVRYAMRDLGRLFLGRELDAILQRERYWSAREANKAGDVQWGCGSFGYREGDALLQDRNAKLGRDSQSNRNPWRWQLKH